MALIAFTRTRYRIEFKVRIQKEPILSFGIFKGGFIFIFELC